MPVRTASWNTQYGLAPIFDMNLPEGALRAYLVRSFARATGTFDDFDLLAVVGRTQIGRIRYSDLDAKLNEDVPFQSIDEILSAKRGGELFAYLLEKFAVHSGLSGIQPKVMIRAVDAGTGAGDRQSQSFRSATHIVKFWDPNEYPELAANEHFCLSAAKAMGLTVPDFHLSDSGAAIVLSASICGLKVPIWATKTFASSTVYPLPRNTMVATKHACSSGPANSLIRPDGATR